MVFCILDAILKYIILWMATTVYIILSILQLFVNMKFIFGKCCFGYYSFRYELELFKNLFYGFIQFLYVRVVLSLNNVGIYFFLSFILYNNFFSSFTLSIVYRQRRVNYYVVTTKRNSPFYIYGQLISLKMRFMFVKRRVNVII